MRLTGKMWAVVLAVVIVGTLGFAFRPQPVAVDLAIVTRGPMTVTVDEEARAQVREIYTVSAPLDGQVLRLDLEPGDTVQAGDAVATIVPSNPSFLDRRRVAEAEAAVRAAEAAWQLAAAEVDEAQARVDFAERELARAQTLATRGNISISALDRAELQVRTDRAALATAQAGLEVRRFELATARAALTQPDEDAEGNAPCCIYVRAPVAGQVLQVLHESAGVVGAGTPLIEIGDPGDLEIVVELLSTAAVAVVPGAPVIITDWGGPVPLEGRLRRIEPFGFTKVSALGVEEQRVLGIVDLVSPPTQWARLSHGFRVTVRVVKWQQDDVLQIPLGAMFRRGDGWAVYVADDGRARLQDIEVGHISNSDAEVQQGLAEGDAVVLHPSADVADNARIARRPSGT